MAAGTARHGSLPASSVEQGRSEMYATMQEMIRDNDQTTQFFDICTAICYGRGPIRSKLRSGSHISDLNCKGSGNNAAVLCVPVQERACGDSHLFPLFFVCLWSLDQLILSLSATIES